ncbi:hypothetical protein N7481_001384 [Penicillium waksmanii]|uniref:uncharacterized protein n=1 Tax=Penicillium waksmanii TaxID=69791 RepID=UPI0025492995|nr:uncharacterized protein N7481_001384 [Penicillium waksmanii]KAJ6000975.1 hypothetical protein N7481_001384 [Penicillium waksmanii]
MTQSRYIPNVYPVLMSVSQPREQLIHCVMKIVSECPPGKPWTSKFKDQLQGLWTGSTSIAYLFLWLAETHPNLSINDRLPIDWCHGYLDCGSDVLSSAQGLNGWGIKNEYLAYNTVKAAVTQDDRYVSKVIKAIKKDFDCPVVDNEHLSGRAASEQVEDCTSILVEQLVNAVPWKFHGHNYIGAAHGVIGILTQIILSRPAMGRDAAIEYLISEQLDLQMDDGHWFITDDPNLGEPDLVHYCHGSPGFVISLDAVCPFVSEVLKARICVAIERGRKEIWEKGILRKEPNLCHGIVGNMLALQDWEQKEHFMAHATAQKIRKGIEHGGFVAGEDPYGLLWGEAGRAWGWAMIDKKLDMGYPS